MPTTNCRLLYFPFCIAMFCLSLIYPHPNDVREAKFYKLEGKSFNGSLVGRHLTQDVWDCLFLCVNATNKDCYSFNFGGAQEKGLYKCELYNSEMKIEPQKIQDRPGFTYYGMTEESFYRYLPCASSPCLHGKECFTGPTDGLYFCQCPLKNIGLNFIDDKCTVDRKQIGKGTMKERVALTTFRERKLNFYEAEKLCKPLDASMASYDQLYSAWNANLSICMNAWINNAKVAYPMRKATAGCGNRVGIIVTKKDKYSRFPVWCHYNE
ncbi:hypothetical protein ACROYT_G020123 [Oculina patagonica]